MLTFNEAYETLKPKFQTIEQNTRMIADWLKKHIKKIAIYLVNQSAHLKIKMTNIWEQTKPKIAKLIEVSTAAATASTTFQTALGLVPVALSILPLLASIPLIGILLPEFFFTEVAIIGLILGLSAFAGYSKYKDIVERNTLDQQIILNQQALGQQAGELKRLADELKTLRGKNKTLMPLCLEGSVPAIYKQGNTASTTAANDAVIHQRPRSYSI